MWCDRWSSECGDGVWCVVMECGDGVQFADMLLYVRKSYNIMHKIHY